MILDRFDALHRRVVARVEDDPTPLSRYALLFVALLAVRLTLEFFSSQRLFTAGDVIHIGLWFVFIVLLMLLQLHLFSGEHVDKVARLTVVFFMFAWSAPLIDLATRGGMPAHMNYLSLNSWPQVLRAYLTLGGPNLARGATLGIRIEIAILVLACFNYLRLKTGSLVRAVVGALSIYTVLFLSGAIPWLLGSLVNAFGLQYGPDDQSTVLLLLTLDLALLGAIVWRGAAGEFRRLAAAIPWGAWLVALLHATLGAGLARNRYPDGFHFDPTTLFWPPLILALALALGAYAGHLRAPVEARDGRVAGGVLLLVAGVGSLLSFRLLFVSVLLWALLFLLGEPPLRIAHVPVARTLFAALLFAAAALFGFVAFGGPLVGFPRPWLLGLLALAAFGGLFAELGRTTDDSVGWPGAWRDATRRRIHGLAFALMLSGFFAAAAAFVSEPRERLWLAFAAPAPLALLAIRPRRTQWIAASLTPAYAVLARAAWEISP